VIAVPVQAVKYEDAEERDQAAKASVFIVKDGKAVQKSVDTDLADDSYIAITKGVAAGDRVVTGSARTLRFLQDGERVREVASTDTAPAGDKQAATTK
jgi:hypothetical protein